MRLPVFAAIPRAPTARTLAAAPRAAHFLAPFKPHGAIPRLEIGGRKGRPGGANELEISSNFSSKREMERERSRWKRLGEGRDGIKFDFVNCAHQRHRILTKVLVKEFHRFSEFGLSS